MVPPVSFSKTTYPSNHGSVAGTSKRVEYVVYSSPDQFNPMFDLLKWGYVGVSNTGSYLFSFLKSGYRWLRPPFQIDLLIENPQAYLQDFNLKPGECLVKLLYDFQASPDHTFKALKAFIADYKSCPRKYACLECESLSNKAREILYLLAFERVKFQDSDKKNFIEGPVLYQDVLNLQPGKSGHCQWQARSVACKNHINDLERMIQIFFYQNYSKDSAKEIIEEAENTHQSKIGELIGDLLTEMVLETKNTHTSNKDTALLWFKLLSQIGHFQANLSRFPRLHGIVNQLNQLLNSGIITQQSIELIIKEIRG